MLASNAPRDMYGTLTVGVLPGTAPASTGQRLAPAAAVDTTPSPPPAASDSARKSVCHRHPCLFIFLALCVTAAIIVGVVLGTRSSGDSTRSDAVETVPSDYCAQAAPDHLRFVSVGTLDGLSRAAANAQPGDLIQLGRSVADDRISGRWSSEGLQSVGQGTPEEPITLCSTPGVTIDGGSWQSGLPVLHLSGLSHWHVRGVSVENGLKGIMLDACEYVVMDEINVNNIGQEAVHFRTNSHHCSLRRSSISYTGLVSAQYGEAVYIGTALSNMAGPDQWDRSDYTLVELNTLGPGVTADHIDIKEGTCCGRVLNNTFNGLGQNPATGVSAWANIKGNDYWFQGNSGFNTPSDGFVTHVVAPGWGHNTTFVANTIDVSRDTEGKEVDATVLATRYGVRAGSASEGITVACANTLVPADVRISNRPCTADVQQI